VYSCVPHVKRGNTPESRWIHLKVGIHSVSYFHPVFHYHTIFRENSYLKQNSFKHGGHLALSKGLLFPSTTFLELPYLKDFYPIILNNPVLILFWIGKVITGFSLLALTHTSLNYSILQHHFCYFK